MCVCVCVCVCVWGGGGGEGGGGGMSPVLPGSSRLRVRFSPTTLKSTPRALQVILSKIGLNKNVLC